MRSSFDKNRRARPALDLYPVLAGPRSSDGPDLESVILSTDELNRRSSRPPDLAAENQALVALARELAAAPDTILQKLVETALTLCRAQSAGVSLLDEERKNFYWPAVAGEWARHVGGGTPRDFGPCGTVLDRNVPLVFTRPERHFTYLSEVTPYLEEALLLPFYVEGQAVGTIWVVGHDEHCRFDSEDMRLMTGLVEFAGAAYQTLIALDRMKHANRQLEQTAAALRENEHRLDELVSSIPAAVYTTDAAGRITFYNEAAAQLWGCRPELGKSEFCGSWKLYWPDGRPMPHDECPMTVALETGQPVRGAEAVAERPDGTRVPFLPYPAPLRDPAGRLVGAINMLVDITERKAIERTVQSQTRRLEALNRVAKVVSRPLDVSQLVQTVTDVATELTGAKFGAFFKTITDERGESSLLYAVSDASREAFDKLGIPRNSALFDATFRGTGVVRSNDIRTDARYGRSAPHDGMPGRHSPVASYLAVSVGRMGRVHGGLFLGDPEPGVFTQETEDIVTGAAAHAAIAIDNAYLYQAERRLASIVETSADAIVSKDLNSIVTSWNHGAERLFGYAAEEMIGKSITILIPADRSQEEPAIMERIRRGEPVAPYETVRVRKDGSLVHISLGVSPVRGPDGRIVGASKIARDITERKQAQARQELLNHELHHRTKNLFAVVNSIVARSFADKTSVKEAEAAVLNRLQSLAQTHIMLIDKQWQGADIGEVVRTEMSPYMDRVTIEGPPIMLNAQAAQNFSMALHELATNAAKYGALSNQTGRVLIDWFVLKPNGHRRFTFRWQERGGPQVSVPTRRGFGSAVLEQVMAEYFDAPPQIEFATAGVRYELSGSLEALTGQR